MINTQTHAVKPFLISQNTRNKEPQFVNPDRISRPILPSDNQVYFERTGENDFAMHVLSGNADEVAKCLDIVG